MTDLGRQETMSTITVPANDRADISFDGHELASVSTRTPGRPRWTELRIYKRDDGGYVFQRVGRSNVYHRVTCRKVFGRLDMDPVPMEDVDPVDSSTCEECQADESDDPTVVFERDKFSAVSVTDAGRLLWAMQDRDRQTQELRVSQLAQELLLHAAQQDEGIREASQKALLSQR